MKTGLHACTTHRVIVEIRGPERLQVPRKWLRCMRVCLVSCPRMRISKRTSVSNSVRMHVFTTCMRMVCVDLYGVPVYMSHTIAPSSINAECPRERISNGIKRIFSHRIHGSSDK
jgi:hypothetical protein